MNETLRYDRLAAAAVRGQARRLGEELPADLLDRPLEALSARDMEDLMAHGREMGVKLYRFKKSHEELPRVWAVLGFLRGIWPESLLDVGSGRGVFLFPFLDAFPDTKVISVDILPYRVEFLQDLTRGGLENLTALEGDLCDQPLPENSVDVVTLLEVLEHIPNVEQAIRAAVRMARQYVVVTVPAQPDDNPEHIHLLTKPVLTELFRKAGCERLSFGGVPGHLVMIARK